MTDWHHRLYWPYTRWPTEYLLFGCVNHREKLELSFASAYAMLLLTYFTPYSDIHRFLTSRPNINVYLIWHQDRTLILDHVRSCFNGSQMPETSMIQYAFAIADVAKLLWPKLQWFNMHLPLLMLPNYYDPKTPKWNQYLIPITLMLATGNASTHEWQTMTQRPQDETNIGFQLVACHVQCCYPWMTDSGLWMTDSDLR